MENDATQEGRTFYRYDGMVYMVDHQEKYALVQGKGWMSWSIPEAALDEKYVISESEARELQRDLGEGELQV